MAKHKILHILPFNYPIFQLVPSLKTGTLLAPPPVTVEANVVAVASVTNALAPDSIIIIFVYQNRSRRDGISLSKSLSGCVICYQTRYDITSTVGECSYVSSGLGNGISSIKEVRTVLHVGRV